MKPGGSVPHLQGLFNNPYTDSHSHSLNRIKIVVVDMSSVPTCLIVAFTEYLHQRLFSISKTVNQDICKLGNLYR